MNILGTFILDFRPLSRTNSSEFRRTPRHLTNAKIGTDHLSNHIDLRGQTLYAPIGTTVGYLQNNFESLALFLMGATIEKCDLKQRVFASIPRIPLITTFSCAEMMAECENPIPLLVT